MFYGEYDQLVLVSWYSNYCTIHMNVYWKKYNA